MAALLFTSESRYYRLSGSSRPLPDVDQDKLGPRLEIDLTVGPSCCCLILSARRKPGPAYPLRVIEKLKVEAAVRIGANADQVV
jgi:hypothetical protein